MPIETRELCNYRRKVTEKETYRKNREMKNAVRRIKNHSLEGKFLEWNNTFQRKKVITFLILLAARNIFLFKKKTKKTARYIRADLDIILMYGKSFRFLNKAFQ